MKNGVAQPATSFTSFAARQIGVDASDVIELRLTTAGNAIG